MKGLGGWDFGHDWLVTGDLTADLRAERSDAGNGRIYTLKIACETASGKVATTDVRVSVPLHRE